MWEFYASKRSTLFTFSLKQFEPAYRFQSTPEKDEDHYSVLENLLSMRALYPYVVCVIDFRDFHCEHFYFVTRVG